MILLFHILVASVIGVKIKNLPLAVFLALVSHYLLDALPHQDYCVKTLNKKREFSFNKVLIGDLLKVFLDAGSAILLVWLTVKELSIYLLLIMVSGILPDFLAILSVFWQNKPLEKIQQFHKRAHFPHESEIALSWKLIIPFFVGLVSVIVLIKG